MEGWPWGREGMALEQEGVGAGARKVVALQLEWGGTGAWRGGDAGTRKGMVLQLRSGWRWSLDG